MTAQGLVQALLNGFILGLIYVAIAIGLTIIFGMLRFVNFSHGAFYAIGAYVGLVVTQKLGFGAGLIAGPIAVALVAIVFDRLLLRFFYDKEPTSQILLTFGLAVIAEETLRLIFGGTTQQYPLPNWLQGSVALAGLQYPAYRIYMAIAIVAIVI